MTCLGIIGVTAFLESCKTSKMVMAENVSNLITVDKSEFKQTKNGKETMRKYITVKSKENDFPIIVYRFKENEYKALLLRCTHLGSELNVHGDLLSCPAHGSEFSNKGEIIQGPADKNLISYTTSTDTNKIYIHLS